MTTSEFILSGRKHPSGDKKCQVITIDSKKLIEYVNKKKIYIPEFQRELDENKIDKIEKEYIERNKNGENYLIKHGYTISLCKLNDSPELCVIDGQHRMKVIERIYSKKYYPEITVRIQLCDNVEEIKKDFEQLNSNSDIPLIYKYFNNKQIQNMIIKIKSKIKEDYKSAFIQTKKSVRSNRLHLDDFMNLFDLNRLSELEITYDELYNKLLEINNEIVDDFKNMDDNDYIKKADKNQIEQTNFYLSLKNIDWIEKIYDNDYKINYNNIKYNKKRIPKTLRKYILDRDFGEKEYIGKCYVCEIQINREDAQMGHIIAECKGGKTNKVNLKAICKTCNCSMGTQNMEDFKQKYFNK